MKEEKGCSIKLSYLDCNGYNQLLNKQSHNTTRILAGAENYISVVFSIY